jgi:hypothetical protein
VGTYGKKMGKVEGRILLNLAVVKRRRQKVIIIMTLIVI